MYEKSNSLDLDALVTFYRMCPACSMTILDIIIGTQGTRLLSLYLTLVELTIEWLTIDRSVLGQTASDFRSCISPCAVNNTVSSLLNRLAPFHPISRCWPPWVCQNTSPTLILPLPHSSYKLTVQNLPHLNLHFINNPSLLFPPIPIFTVQGLCIQLIVFIKSNLRFERTSLRHPKYYHRSTSLPISETSSGLAQHGRRADLSRHYDALVLWCQAILGHSRRRNLSLQLHHLGPPSHTLPPASFFRLPAPCRLLVYVLLQTNLICNASLGADLLQTHETNTDCYFSRSCRLWVPRCWPS